MRPHSKKSIVHNLYLVITLYVQLENKNIIYGYILVIVIVKIVIVIFDFVLITGEIHKKKQFTTLQFSTFLQNELVLCVSINKSAYYFSKYCTHFHKVIPKGKQTKYKLINLQILFFIIETLTRELI